MGTRMSVQFLFHRLSGVCFLKKVLKSIVLDEILSYKNARKNVSIILMYMRVSTETSENGQKIKVS